MSYEIYLPQTFQKCIKLLKKKYPHIKEDLSPLFQNLQKDPQIGDAIPGWNRKIWKIRASSRDLKRGKSGAFRYLRHMAIPGGYPEDAYHIAIAVVNDMDFLLSWNFRHIVRRRTKDVVRMVNTMNKFGEIEIITPAELL